MDVGAGSSIGGSQTTEKISISKDRANLRFYSHGEGILSGSSLGNSKRYISAHLDSTG